MNLLKHGKKKAIYLGMILLLLCLCFYVAVNLEMKNNDNENAAKEQEYVNPYAEYTETFSGDYLYDIYEANRGSNADGDWFVDGSERFTYYEICSPPSEASLNIEWKIELAEMKGTGNLAREFNNYHSNLFESRKEKMKNSQEKVMEMNEDELRYEWERYGSRISTRASFAWGNIFTVVDIANPHYRGCRPVIANFNSESGKMYELKDVFSTENYAEELLDIIREETGYENGWRMTLTHPDSFSFVIGYQGLLIIDDCVSSSVLFGWNYLKDILSQEMLNEVENVVGSDVFEVL